MCAVDCGTPSAAFEGVFTGLVLPVKSVEMQTLKDAAPELGCSDLAQVANIIKTINQGSNSSFSVKNQHKRYNQIS